MRASNAPLYLLPEMLDELLTYVYMPKDIETAIPRRRKAILADPTKHP